MLQRTPRRLLKRAIKGLPPDVASALLYDWEGIWARPSQIWPEGDWSTWLIRPGRGWGKTRTGAENTNRVAKRPELCGGFIALVGRTASDVRDTMIDGESGILACSPPWFMPKYEPSKRRLTWPNGVRAIAYSGDEPRLLRGPQHGFAWLDELPHYQYAEDVWDMLQFGLRLGDDPRSIITSTPLPTQFMRDLLKSREVEAIFETTGSTNENRANLPDRVLKKLYRKYGGSRLGKQELDGIVLDDNPGALWRWAWLRANAVRKGYVPQLTKIVIAVDPATTSGRKSDQTGIVVAGLGVDGHVYILEDATGETPETKRSPGAWAKEVARLFAKWQANKVVAERNQGGEMVERTLRQEAPHLPLVTVHAKQGKRTRAEPVATLDEQGRVHHVVPDIITPGGTTGLELMEEQMCMVDPDEAAKNDALYDRADARTYAVTELLVESGGGLTGGDLMAAMS